MMHFDPRVYHRSHRLLSIHLLLRRRARFSHDPNVALVLLSTVAASCGTIIFIRLHP
jgi:hypothetical protein